MNNLRSKKILYWAIEINCILWLVLFGWVMGHGATTIIKRMIFGAFIFSALLQHWAYYHIYKIYLQKKQD